MQNDTSTKKAGKDSSQTALNPLELGNHSTQPSIPPFNSGKTSSEPDVPLLDSGKNSTEASLNPLERGKTSAASDEDSFIKENKKTEPSRIASIYNALHKALLSEKKLAANIVWNFVSEYKDKGENFTFESIEKDTFFLNKIAIEEDGYTNEIKLPNEEKVTFDLVFKTILKYGSEEVKKLIIHIEIQENFSSFDMRGGRSSIYNSQLISSQLRRLISHNNYDELTKVCGIWIFTNPPKDDQNSFIEYAMQPIEALPKYTISNMGLDYSSIIMIKLGNYKSIDILDDNQKDENRPSNDNDKYKCIQLLDKLFFKDTPLDVTLKTALSVIQDEQSRQELQKEVRAYNENLA